ncbi:class A beta-lactamase [Terriglobus sp.]|uniref:class A beta-lactamase n=1 Tax=Terriglobus sp. TaxID=1889013 RepID=UPI003AFFC38C
MLPVPSHGQDLRQQLAAIAKDSGGKLQIACAFAPGSRHAPIACDRDADAHPPMQSVFKLPLGIYVLHLVEQGKLQLDQPVHFESKDLFEPKAYSPLQDKYPAGNVDVPLRELLHLSVSFSDNAAADILLRLSGGTEPVRQYIASLGVQGFELHHSEHALQRDERLQYQDWFAPAAAVQLLRRIADNSPLIADHTALLLQWMTNSARPGRLAGMLPKGTNVAHKTGSSGMENGLAAATNDIGLVTLPDGERLAVAVFLTDSTADDAGRDRAIARASLAIYQAAIAGASKE